MAVSSYGSGTQTSGVVRILKDLDRDITGEHVLIVEDIIDSGLTLSWLLKNLRSRSPGLDRGRDAAAQAGRGEGATSPVNYVGFDIPNEFVVGYGLDYAERYRDLPYIGRLQARCLRGLTCTVEGHRRVPGVRCAIPSAGGTRTPRRS